jgi:lecithin:cholesterol acyltransferase
MVVTSPRSRDAVVVVPGIMGSELEDAESGRVLWGLSNPGWYVSAWTSGASLRELELSDAEREGRYGRVRATRLLRVPAFAPLLAGFEPYTKLLSSLRQVSVSADAVAEFPYDWRLPVLHNAGLLAEFAAKHLARWRTHPVQLAAQREDLDGDRPAQLVIVAHSMGGLLAAEVCRRDDLMGDLRTVMTMGAPFYGAPRAVELLGPQATGRRLLPWTRVRQLAKTLPGIYDLLPTYRCVTDGPSARRLTAVDIADLGGDKELAQQFFDKPNNYVMPELVQVVGAHQPTPQAVTITGGAVTAHRHTVRRDGQREDTGGDGTVPRESAALPYLRPMPLAQAHGGLAATVEAILVARDVLLDRRTGPWLGDSELGLDIPDIVPAGQPFQIHITGAERPIDVTCALFDLERGGQRIDTPAVRLHDGVLTAVAKPLPPGLFQVRVEGGSASPVSQILMSTEPIEDEL